MWVRRGFSAELGCRSSGDRARRRSGELVGSQLLGRMDLGTAEEGAGCLLAGGEWLLWWAALRWAGMVCWGRWELPTWCPCTPARGLGERAGDEIMLEGEGVRARGLRGKLCTDLRRCGDLREEVFLCFATCRELGRPMCTVAALTEAAAGELGTLEDGELLLELVACEESGDQGTVMGGERMVRCSAGLPSHEDAERLSGLKVRGGGPMCVPWTTSGSPFLLRRLSKVRCPFFRSAPFSFIWRFRMARRAILPGAAPLGREQVLMEVLSSGTQRMLSTAEEDRSWTTCV